MSDEKKIMTFAKEVKAEIANLPYKSKIMRFGVLSGFTRINGETSLGSVPSITYKTEIASVAKLIFSLVKDMYDITPRIIYQRKMRFNKSMDYVIKVESKKTYEILSELKVMKNFQPVPLRSMLNKENLRYFLAGAFMAGGSVNAPSSKSYFLEISFSNKDDATRVMEALQSTEEFSAKVIQRRDKWIVYLKRSSEIAMFLSYIGATNSMLNYENARVTKDLINNENRLDICAAHNYSKSLKKGQENIEDINKLLSRYSMDRFDVKTQAVMKARLSHPDSSFGELAELITEDGIFISKSGVSHILSSLHEKASKF